MKSKVYKIEKIAGTKFLSYYDLKYKNKNGKQKSWSAVSRADIKDYEKRLFEKSNQRDAVLIGAYHIDMQKLVLVKQFRVPLNDYIYEIPAGLIDKGEDVLTSAKRELFEETGLELIEITEVFENLYVSPGVTDECVDIVFCTCKGDISDLHLEEDEDIEIGLYDEEEVRRILADKNKMDIKTLLVMQMFILSTGMWKVEKK
jgi:hydrolase, NUDIX family